MNTIIDKFRMMDRDKKAIFLGAIFTNVVLLILLIKDDRKFNLIITLFSFGIINLLFYGMSHVDKVFKALKIETRIDGDLKLKAKKQLGIVKCLNCNEFTISHFHAKKQPQTCGECGKMYKAINFKLHDGAVIFLVLLSLLGKLFFLRGNYKIDLILLVVIFVAGYFLSKGGEIKEVESNGI